MNVGKLNLAKLIWRKNICLLLFLCAGAISSSAQTFTTLISFDGANGAEPFSKLVQGFDGNLYGTTQIGGTNQYDPSGTVFKITTDGTLTTLYTFCPQPGCPDGKSPAAGLALGIDGNFYGTTFLGGYPGFGTIFKITPEGTQSILHTFQGTEGGNPTSGLIEASNGAFYGVAPQGGTHYQGTVFMMAAGPKVTRLYSFCSQPSCADGEQPSGPLMQGTDGNFYGTTPFGGTNNTGTIFQITPAGVFKTLHTFGGADGSGPTGGTVQAKGSSYIYGTTAWGGKYNQGTVFRIDRAGNLTTIHSFCSANCADGSQPSGLIQATDGNFYGTTQYGGFPVCSSFFRGCGTIYKITPTGVLTTLYTFCTQANCLDGEVSAGLVQATDGNFYATSAGGGAYDYGTVFRLSTGLAPFVETVPASGKVGTTITILGTNLTGATAVTFKGTAAAFTVVSGTEITATVPSGATTGTVTVTTPSGTLNSNVVFRVRP